jgi:hypothetical protein
MLVALSIPNPAAPSALSGNGYHAYEDSQGRYVHDDLSRAKPNRLGIWYFKEASSTSDLANKWGSEADPSLEEVMRSHAFTQKIEMTACEALRHAGRPSAVLTYFSPLGPIAVCDYSSPAPTAKYINEAYRLRRKLTRGAALGVITGDGVPDSPVAAGIRADGNRV